MFKQILFCLVFICFAEKLEAQVYMTESGHAEFHSSVPLHSFKGTSDHLVGKIDLNDSTVDFYIDLDTFETGIGKRDRDMRQTLNTEEYPFAEFFGNIVTPFDTSSSEPQQTTVEGDFSIHGVTQKVKIDGTLQKTDEGLQVQASWIVRLEDHNIKPPGILFYRVNQEQEVKIDALLTPVNE